MAKGSNIVHQYFKKDFEGNKIFVKVNPFTFTGTEIMLTVKGDKEIREMEFDEEIFEDLKADGFEDASPLEFNLHLSGLV